MRFIRQFRSRRGQRGFIINPFAFGAGGGGPSGGLLGSYTANVWGGYALYQLWSSWTGNLIRVRRSSDNTEQDIGQSSGVLDISSLNTFVGANDGYITKWYDQTGLGHDFPQATTSKQPKIVDAGTYCGEILWSEADPDRLVTTASSGTPNAFTVYFAGRNRQPSPGGTNAFTCLLNRGDGQFGVSVASSSGNFYFVISLANSSGNTEVFGAAAEDATTLAAVMDLTQGTITTQNVLYKNGTAMPPDGFQAGTIKAAPFAASTWNASSIGTADTNNARMAATAIVIYEAAHNSATVAAVSPLLKPAKRVNTLDSYAAGSWAIYSFVHRVTAYAGSCIRVRRSSDNTEQDIGFSSNVLDTTSLLAFVGAGSGYVTKWYDQSGSAHDASQVTQANQPRIVNAGVVEAYGIYGDGTNYFLTTANATSRATFTYYIKARHNSSTGIRTLLQLSSQPITNSGCCAYQNGQNLVVVTGSPTNYNFRQAPNAPVSQVLCGRHDHSSSTNTTNAQILSGGGLLTTTSVLASGTLSGNFSANPWQIMKGDTGGGTNYFLGWIDELVIREALDSDATADRISRALGG